MWIGEFVENFDLAAGGGVMSSFEARRSPDVGDLGSNMRAARKKLKLTQEEIGERSGVHPTEISRMEANKRDPQVSTLLKLAEALEVSPGQLLK
jgi:DNA-binding XRE family transcriptional regulator